MAKFPDSLHWQNQ